MVKQPQASTSYTVILTNLGSWWAGQSRAHQGGIFLALAVPGLLILGAGGRGKRRSGAVRAMLFVLLVGFSLISFNGCGSSGGSGGGGTPAGRVAQTSASTKHIVGAPSFAHFAKGGTED